MIEGLRKVELNENAMQILQKRYLREDTPEEMFWRVATCAAEAELSMNSEGKQDWAIKFYDMMASLDFLPNSPTLMNAKRASGQLSACFVLPVEDSMEGIFKSISDMAMIQKTGGGTGFSFSRLRPTGDTVTSTVGEASGPISFMEVFNSATEAVKQGGARRGANMGLLRVDHPDIFQFIDCKQDLTKLTNFNISVGITNEFMNCLIRGEMFTLKFGGVDYMQVDPKDIMNRIVRNAWKTGEPGVIFLDVVNSDSTFHYLGDMEATNPCGEQPLLPYEACNLGSINLANMVLRESPTEIRIDWHKMKRVVHHAVRFLDDIIDVNKYPLPIIAEKVRQTRKIGLGVMGWADVLIKLEVPYDSPEALCLAEQVMNFIQEEARASSANLFLEKGPYEAYRAGNPKRRNVAITTIAPTGTISIAAGVSSGIEPLFALSYHKKLADGRVMPFINPLLWEYMERKSFTPEQQEEILNLIEATGSIKGSPMASKFMQELFKVSNEISPRGHIEMQAAFQGHIDNAVSKTINFSNDVTEKQIYDAFVDAWHLGCKGLTVYRDGSRNSQPLNKGKEEIETEEEDFETEVKTPEVSVEYVLSKTPYKKIRPTKLQGTTEKVKTGCGSIFITMNHDGRDPFEVFLETSGGGCSAFTNGTARLISLALRYGVPVEEIVDQLKSVRCDNFRYQSGKDPTLKGKSCPDVVGNALREVMSNLQQEAESPFKSVVIRDIDEPIDMMVDSAEDIAKVLVTKALGGGVCPECGGFISRAEGCVVCHECGYSKC